MATIGKLSKKQSILIKSLLPIVAIVLVGVGMIVTYMVRASRTATVAQSQASGINTIKQFKELRSYYTKNIVSVVKANGGAKIAIEHANDPNAIPLPATMIHDLSKQLKENVGGQELKLYSEFPFPNRKNRALDGFGADAVEHFKTSPDDTYVREESIDGVPVVRVAIADRMAAQACVDCHNNHPQTPKNDWKLGDVRGVLEVVSPIDQQLAANAVIVRNVSLIAVGSVALIIVTIFFILKAVSSRMKRTVGVLDRVGSGDLTQRVAIENNDEVGQMSGALNETVERIQTFMKSIVQSIDTLTHSSSRLSDLSTNMTRNAQETSSQAGTVAGSAQEISNNVESAAAGVEEMGASIREIAHNANSAASVASSAVEASDQANRTITKLSDSSKEISHISNMITSIAEQTNLLALNATIEAARAGDAGKGFAVVANEVKELAKQTSTATEDISRKIETIQIDTNEAIQAITQISSVIEQVNDISMTIASAVEEQTATTSEMGRNLGICAGGTSEIARNINGVADNARGTEEAIVNTQKATMELQNMADQLRGLVSAFKY